MTGNSIYKGHIIPTEIFDEITSLNRKNETLKCENTQLQCLCREYQEKGDYKRRTNYRQRTMEKDATIQALLKCIRILGGD